MTKDVNLPTVRLLQRPDLIVLSVQKALRLARRDRKPINKAQSMTE